MEYSPRFDSKIKIREGTATVKSLAEVSQNDPILVSDSHRHSVVSFTRER